VWAWLAAAADTGAAALTAATAAHPAVRVAVGPSGAGADGFRRSHFDAVATQRLMSRRPDLRVARFADVQLVTLALQDEQRAREFVALTLGTLADADRELRDTLCVYIGEQFSAARAARALYTHRNTVLNWLQRAERLLPFPLAGHGLEVGVALEIAQWLGSQPGSATHASEVTRMLSDRTGATASAGLRDRAVTELYSLHYRPLVRLAVLLVRDLPTAEDVVQDLFVALHGGWQRLRDPESALAYLRLAVLNRSRTVLRHRAVADKHMQKPPPDMPSAEHGALAQLEQSAVVAGLRKLTDRQREAIVLRYYADFCEAGIAAAMGINCGAVKSHTARGMAALRAELDQQDQAWKP